MSCRARLIVLMFAASSMLFAVAKSELRGQTIDVLDETMLLNNGAPTSDDTNDAEDNFGGRNEWIIGNNNGNARGGLMRFDVSSVADSIGDASQVVVDAALVMNTADAREAIQPTSDTLFDVYIVVPENAGWFEGTQQGSRAGWSGEPESASQLYLANPEGQPEDPLSDDLEAEFDDVRFWHSTLENDGFPIPFEVGIDTSPDSIGNVSTEEIDADGFLTISLNPTAINSLLPAWLADPEENPGLYVYPTDGEGQWFFESSEGFEDEAIDLVLTFGAGGVPGDYDGNGELEAADVDLLIAELNVAEPSLQFDANGDGSVDDGDLKHWVKELKKTWVGDANLDGEFNSGDLVETFSVGKYEKGEAAGWGDGDWDGDQLFTSADFVAAFSDGGYEQGPVPASAAAVPEPSASLLALVGMICVLIRRR